MVWYQTKYVKDHVINLTFLIIYSLFFQYSTVNTAIKYTKAGSPFTTMYQKLLQKVHVQKYMSAILLQTQTQNEPWNVNFQIAMGPSVPSTQEERITITHTKNCSTPSTKTQENCHTNVKHVTKDFLEVIVWRDMKSFTLEKNLMNVKHVIKGSNKASL